MDRLLVFVGKCVSKAGVLNKDENTRNPLMITEIEAVDFHFNNESFATYIPC